MIAEIKKNARGYTARFERYMNHSAEKVWAYLTENDKLGQWFTELRMGELREGGVITFDMGDGTFDHLTILELKTCSVLKFTWWEDTVRFELFPETEGCLLVFTEEIKSITPQTAKDLAGWHVCLDVIKALLDGRSIENRMNDWEGWYPKYIEAVEHVTAE
ncbi:SRPBCC family protein [Bacillus sp. MRMR6]|uniref:SRPBCC family protein n=1 Tax=Bacillus sp. MRMR6 TaxID=1928617 RepID=UPI000951F369|nr:SRPBCC family protein [Bacillus sp. MRMR6]OLS41716.1 activator of Hsp90 ATPase 1 family protein [Bacillus sp. MRMR6]